MDDRSAATRFILPERSIPPGEKRGALLRAIDGFSKILLREQANKLDDEGKRLLGIVIQSTRRMGQLIDDLLQFSRLGRTEMKNSPIEVLINLIGNAIKYTLPRNVARIEIGGRVDASEALYFIRDNGVGFSMDHAKKLFGVFQRLHTSEEFEGTGVGLALVQRIIERHGGRVWAEATVNEGATFYFTLPHVEEPPGLPGDRG